MVKRLGGLGAVLVVLACGEDGARSEPLRPASALPHVVFTTKTMVIDRLGTPVAIPVAAGSTVTPQSVKSEQPDVAYVDDDGRAVGVRKGRARFVSSTGESILDVEVAPALGIRVTPADVKLMPGERIQFNVTADGGFALDHSAVRWATSAPRVGFVSSGLVEAREPGTARIVAQYGGHTAEAVVIVEGVGPSFSVVPGDAQTFVGGVVAFQALGDEGSVAAEWRSTRPDVMANLGEGVFHARSRGTATVCATAVNREACVRVEVTR